MIQKGWLQMAKNIPFRASTRSGGNATGRSGINPEEQKRILGMLDVHDADKDFWRLPIRVLDGWMLSAEKLLHLGNNTKSTMWYVKHL